MNGKEIEAIEEQCPRCGSVDADFDESEKFYECNVCKNVWVYDQDDPDYLEVSSEEFYEDDCPACNGTGEGEDGYECKECGGSGIDESEGRY